jgi:hypothetical protein
VTFSFGMKVTLVKIEILRPDVKFICFSFWEFHTMSSS